MRRAQHDHHVKTFIRYLRAKFRKERYQSRRSSFIGLNPW